MCVFSRGGSIFLMQSQWHRLLNKSMLHACVQYLFFLLGEFSREMRARKCTTPGPSGMDLAQYEGLFRGCCWPAIISSHAFRACGDSAGLGLYPQVFPCSRRSELWMFLKKKKLNCELRANLYEHDLLLSSLFCSPTTLRPNLSGQGNVAKSETERGEKKNLDASKCLCTFWSRRARTLQNRPMRRERSWPRDRSLTATPSFGQDETRFRMGPR